MRTTIDLPEAVLARAQAVAATRGMSINGVVAEVLEEHLRRWVDAPRGQGSYLPWMAGFGELADLADENWRILALIEEEFGSCAKSGECR